MIAVKSRVALAPAPEFTGTVQRDEGGLFTVEFDCGGRGWLRDDDLIEIPDREDESCTPEARQPCATPPPSPAP